MAKIYYKQIIKPNSTFTIDNVPDRWKADVEKMLEGEST